MWLLLRFLFSQTKCLLESSRPFPSDTGETSVSFSFAGSAVVIFGTVVNGTQGQPMNVSATIDAQTAEVPTYTPSPAITPAGVDNNNQIFSKGALAYQVHTVKVSFILIIRSFSPILMVLQLTVTGNTSFYVRPLLLPYLLPSRLT